MHDEARHFMRAVQRMFPDAFASGRVLDAGGADINGNNRHLFGPDVRYVSNDVLPGRNVDVVCPTGDLALPDGHFSAVVSTECFEHDARWRASLRNAVRMLRDGGLLAFTCASAGRAEHGTRRTTADESLTARLDDPALGDYYANLVAEDVRPILDELGVAGRFWYNERSKDMYFVGVKLAYSAPGVSQVFPPSDFETPM